MVNFFYQHETSLSLTLLQIKTSMSKTQKLCIPKICFTKLKMLGITDWLIDRSVLTRHNICILERGEAKPFISNNNMKGFVVTHPSFAIPEQNKGPDPVFFIYLDLDL
jgi:hypothetical protein